MVACPGYEKQPLGRRRADPLPTHSVVFGIFAMTSLVMLLYWLVRGFLKSSVILADSLFFKNMGLQSGESSEQQKILSDRGCYLGIAGDGPGATGERILPRCGAWRE